MKFYALLLMTITCSAVHAQDHKLEKLWETDTIIAVPESVLPDKPGNVLFISLIDGAPWDADGKGGVGKLSATGKKYDPAWITGLNAPKGMGILGDRLYVADISEVVVIDIKKGKIETKIAVDSAKGLNDITVTDKGIVYVSDSRTAKIWRIENNKPTLYLENMKGVNGLKAVGNDLIIASGKSFVKADAQKKITPIAELPQGGDGIEPVGNGDYVVTAWAGYIFYVQANGKVTTLLETYNEKKNTADIGYDPEKKILYVPTFNAKTVVAYSLK
ncbi:MAG TPA: ATP-binding protein [Chitinophagaceae bacterium]